MKVKYFLIAALALCLCGTGAWAQTTCYPTAADYNTGSTDGVTKTRVSEAAGYDTEDGWFKFDTTAILDTASIAQVDLHFYVNDTYYCYWSTTPISNDPVTTDAATLNDDIVAEASTGYYNYQNEGTTYAPGWKMLTLGGTAAADLQANLASDWFGVGVATRDSSPTFYLICDGWAETNVPYIVVTEGTVATCDDELIDLGSMYCADTLTDSGDTTGASNFCGNASGDAHYSFEVLEAGTYTISLCGSSYDTYLRLYDDACCGFQIAYNDDAAACSPQSEFDIDLVPGTYYVHVEGYSSNEGAYTLTITCTSESCADYLTDLGSMTCADVISTSGSNLGALDWCGSVSGDTHYSFEVLEYGDYTITTCSAGTDFDTYLRLYDDMCCGNQIAYNDQDADCSSADQSTIEVVLDPGVYYVLVEGYGAAEGNFDLNISCAPAVCAGPDTCAEAIDVGTGGTFIGDLSYCTNDFFDYSCLSYTENAADHLYSINVPDCGGNSVEVCVTLTPLESWDPAVALAYECSDGALTVNCVAGADSGFTGDPESVCYIASPGTLYIYVDGYSSTTYGEYQLDVTMTSDVAGDTCATAADISAGGTFSGDSSCANDDYDGSSCIGWTTPGEDVAYAFTIDDATTVDITVTPTQTWDPAIYVVGDCGDIVGTYAGCADAGFEGDPEALSIDFGCGGTYYLIIDSYYYAGDPWAYGTFDIDITTTVNPPVDTFDADIECLTPVVDLVAGDFMSFVVTIHNTFTTHRQVGGEVSVTLCNGQTIHNVRAGNMTLPPGTSDFIDWSMPVRVHGKTCNCDLVWTVNAWDQTPCETAGMSPAGWTETDACIVTTICIVD